MIKIEIGDRFRAYETDSQTVVTALAVETCFVLVEHRDRKYSNNGVEGRTREWWPRGWFDNRLVRRE